MTKQEFIKARTDTISRMLDNPDEDGIYPTTICYAELDDLYDRIVLSDNKANSIHPEMSAVQIFRDTGKFPGE